MILTCPECATSYFVDDARIPSGGRTVKCASCGARWTAVKEEPAIPTSEDRQALAHPDPVVADALAAATQDAPVVATSDPEPAFQSTRLDTARPKRGKAPPKAAVWAAAAALAALVVTGAVMFRSEITRLLPGADGADLVIEGVKAQPTFEAGRPVLSVSGEIRNKGHEALEAPSLHIRLLDKSGKAVATTMAEAEDGHLPPGARRYFIVAVANPPRETHDLEVTFAEAVKGKVKAGAKKQGAEVHAAEPHAAEPEEAKPLPPGSPDALDDHHG